MGNLIEACGYSLHVIGGAFQKPTLIKLAYSFEQVPKFRKPLKSLASNETH